MIASALALAYYAYQDVADVSAALEAQVRKTAEAQARDALAGVEKELNERVHAFFTDLQRSLAPPPAETPPATEGTAPAAPPAATEPCAIETGPLIDFFVVYDDTPKKPRPDCQQPQAGAARKGDPFFAQIEALDEKEPFDWKKIPPRTPKYVHGRTPQHGSTLLVLTILKGPDDRVHHVIARMNLKYIQSNLLYDALVALERSYRVAVVDEEWNTVRDLVLGGADSGRGFIVSLPLGSVLWAWHLRLAPSEFDLDALRKQVDRRRFLRLSLIVMSTSIIAVGLAIVLLAVMAERRTSRIKSDFIANVSHELKTPLSLIRMFGEMVATGRHKGEAAARDYGASTSRASSAARRATTSPRATSRASSIGPSTSAGTGSRRRRSSCASRSSRTCRPCAWTRTPSRSCC
jgi:hypothetical protein